jgi:outer membrane protein assembly factor BamB
MKSAFAMCETAVALLNNKKTKLAVQCAMACMFACMLTSAAFGAAAVTISTASGPPTTKLTVSGSGFAAGRLIDIYFDTTDEVLTVSSSTGTFTKIALQVPAAALPGTHWVTATVRATGVAAQASFLVQTNWAERGFTGTSKRTNPYENVLSPSTVGSIDMDWSFPSGVAGFSSPAVANGVVYIGSNNFSVYAVNATTGVQLWSFATGGAVNPSPAVANGVVYVGSDDQNVYALNATTGAKLWSFTTGYVVFSSPVVANGVAYVGSKDSTVYALNASTGAKLWSFTTGGGIYSSPAVANGVVYVGSGDQKVYAVNATTGAQLWSFATGAFLSSSPAVANGRVYVGSYNGNVYALNASTGAKLWSFQGTQIDSSPAVANGVVYVGSFDKNLYALNSSTGGCYGVFPPAIQSSPPQRSRMAWCMSGPRTTTCMP